jgi:hypothetical protein
VESVKTLYSYTLLEGNIDVTHKDILKYVLNFAMHPNVLAHCWERFLRGQTPASHISEYLIAEAGSELPG